MKVNLLPQELRRRAGVSPWLRYLGGFIIFLVLVPMLYTIWLYLDVARLSRAEAVLATRLEELRPLDALLTERNALAQEVQVLRQAVGEREHFIPSIYLAELLKLLPAQTVMGNLSLNKDVLSFSGTVGSYTEAAYLLVLFESSQLFANPVLSGLTAAEAGYSFSFTVELAEGVE